MSGDKSAKENGKFIKNRSGTPLCSASQTGNCSPGPTPGHNGRCVRDTTLAHQFNGCLSRDHGGNICTATGLPAKDRKGQKGKGKGKKQRQW